MTLQTLIPILLYGGPMLLLFLLYGPMAFSIWQNLYYPSCWSCGKRTAYKDIMLFKESEVVYHRLCLSCLEKGKEANNNSTPSIQQWTLLDYALDTTKQETLPL